MIGTVMDIEIGADEGGTEKFSHIGEGETVSVKPTPKPPAKLPNKVRSGGAVVWRVRTPGFLASAMRAAVSPVISPDDLEVLIVHRPGYHDWSFPKGKTELNEPLPVAAIREVEEEAHVTVRLHRPLTCQRYRLSSGVIKEVHYWAATPLTGSSARAARRPVASAPGQEVDEIRWCSLEEARELLTRRGDQRLLDELAGYAQEGTLLTGTVMYVRNGKSEDCQEWEESTSGSSAGASYGNSSSNAKGSFVGGVGSNGDISGDGFGTDGAGSNTGTGTGMGTATAPGVDGEAASTPGSAAAGNWSVGSSSQRVVYRQALNRLGGGQALDLVPLLSAFGVNRLWSSWNSCCQQTLQPYAALARLPIESFGELVEDTAIANPQAVAEVSRLALSEVCGESLAVCARRLALPSLLQPVRQAASSLGTANLSHIFGEIPEEPEDEGGALLESAEMLIAHVVNTEEGVQVVAAERHQTYTKIALNL